MSDSNDGDGRSAPEGNGNAEKHSLYSDRDKLYQRLEDHEQQLVVQISQDLLDKVEGEVGAYEREAIRNIAVDAVKRRRANEHIMTEDIVRDGSENSDRVNQAYSRLVRDTTKELEKLGLLKDGPEMKKAEAQQGWMAQIEQAKDSSERDDSLSESNEE